MTFDEREHALGMLAFEKRAVIPLKWLMLVVSVYFLTLFDRPYWFLPEVETFALFYLYFLFNLLQSYFFYLRPVHPHQIRPFVVSSYMADLVFVTGLVYMDARGKFGQQAHYDLFVFYFLIILRGVAIFRTARGKLLMNVILSAVLALAAWQTLYRGAYNPLQQRDLALKLWLIWMVMLVAWFIVDLINGQAVQLVRVRERLLRSEHLATIGELAAGVAHEINNPIGIISANCEFLLKTTPAGDPLREEIETIFKETTRVQGIVRRLLDFSRPRQEADVECDIRILNEEIAALVFRAHDAEDFQYTAHYRDKLPLVMGDPNQFKQALLNVYLNARQAAGDEGKVEATFESARNGSALHIVIADNGPAVKAEQLQKAFEPFFTSRQGGTGLGLTVTRRILENYGGEIALEPNSPKGVRVKITLPARAA